MSEMYPIGSVVCLISGECPIVVTSILGDRLRGYYISSSRSRVSYRAATDFEWYRKDLNKSHWEEIERLRQDYDGELLTDPIPMNIIHRGQTMQDKIVHGEVILPPESVERITRAYRGVTIMPKKDKDGLPNIAVCYLVSFSGTSQAKLVEATGTIKSGPYSYLNNLDIDVGDHALVHNGSSFGVVEVARLIPLTEVRAAVHITTPLLAPVDIDLKRIRKDFESISNAADMIAKAKRDVEIDDMLGIQRELDGSVKKIA